MSSNALTSGSGSRAPADASSADQDDKPGDAGRRILRATDRAILASAQRDSDGWPYPSLVLAALDHDAAPLLFISTLADHTRNIAAQARVGLLFSAPHDPAAPLAGPRVSLLGRAVPSGDPRHRDRFLARHPSAAVYKGFADFAVYRVAVERAHVVTGLATGFARSVWVDGADLLLDAVPAALAAEEAALIGALNGADGDLVQSLAPAPADGGRWSVTGIDPEGVDLRCGAAIARFDFDHRVHDVEGVRAALSRQPAPAAGMD